jgi:hypothetical protein
MYLTELKITKLNERVGEVSKTVETLKASNESTKQMKKIEELEMKLATVVLDMKKKAISEGTGDEKIDQNKKNELNTENWIGKEIY